MRSCYASFSLSVLLVSVYAGAASPQRPTLSSLPAAAQSSISASIGRDFSEYLVQSNAGELSVTNQGLHYRFNAQGLKVSNDKMAWGLALRAYGYCDDLRLLPAVAPRAAGNRVEYRYGSITEWYVNGPAGLEQGFTINQTPGKTSSGPLTIALALSGNLTAAIDESRTALTLKAKDGSSALSYSGLSAVDADRKELRAWLEVGSEQLLLHIDDAGARYPVTIDPFVQRAQLTTTENFQDESGLAAAIDGNTVAMSGPGLLGTGAVYVFVKPASGWTNMTQTARLTPSEAGGIGFGRSIGISGNTIVVGAPNDNQSNGQLGAAYVFVEPSGGWVDMNETAKLTASDGKALDLLGTSVAVSGNTIVAGIVSPFGNGKTYVFVKPASGWASGTQTAELTVSGDSSSAFTGSPVAIDGDTVAAGGSANGGTSNKAFVFVRPAGGWADMTQTAVLDAANPEPRSGSSRVIGISGNIVAFGDPLATENGVTNAGTVYVFVKPSGGWTNMTPTAQLTASDPTFPAQFGAGVAVNGTSIVVGAPTAKVGTNTAQGAVYLFVQPATGWTNMTETAKLTKANGRPFDTLGSAVGISGKTIVATAPNALALVGAGYIFGQ
jgi:trimeric autotransporter adhesin